ncbi:hypothetical protein [Sulfolobus acidocaldarius]|nr:hypothetical protein [Sulfolobus acidocaldarius]ALU29711.1 hypothetical protein ATY89_06995 [Sulfolobus acidocaldarius]ALU32448.1 hypothetical protein ATZ20_10015 [Sulfolobus acidocaldarius]
MLKRIFKMSTEDSPISEVNPLKLLPPITEEKYNDYDGIGLLSIKRFSLLYTISFFVIIAGLLGTLTSIPAFPTPLFFIIPVVSLIFVIITAIGFLLGTASINVLSIGLTILGKIKKDYNSRLVEFSILTPLVTGIGLLVFLILGLLGLNPVPVLELNIVMAIIGIAIAVFFIGMIAAAIKMWKLGKRYESWGLRIGGIFLFLLPPLGGILTYIFSSRAAKKVKRTDCFLA